MICTYLTHSNISSMLFMSIAHMSYCCQVVTGVLGEGSYFSLNSFQCPFHAQFNVIFCRFCCKPGMLFFEITSYSRNPEMPAISFCMDPISASRSNGYLGCHGKEDIIKRWKKERKKERKKHYKIETISGRLREITYKRSNWAWKMVTYPQIS